MTAYLRRFRHFMRLVGPSLACAHAFCWLTGWHPVRTVRVGGFQTAVRLGTSDLKVAIAAFIGREYEPITLARAEVIVDAGANIGTSAAFFARKWPGARILAIEPEADNFALLLRNASRWPNVVPIRAALWGSDTQMQLRARATGPWGFSIAAAAQESTGTTQTVECLSLATLMHRYGVARIDLLKLDIEGAEKDVFSHAGPWIEDVDVIAVELHDRIQAGCGTAFLAATDGWARRTRSGEKIIAYRTAGGTSS